MKTIDNVSRRSFLQQAFGAGAFVLGARLLPTPAFAALESAAFSPNIFVGVKSDGTVLIVAHRSEMGTSSRTMVPMILADEMEADWKRVTLEQAIGDAKYGSQNTDGSCSIRDFYKAMRVAGASAKLMLERAAAKQWNVPVGECQAKNHEVVHAKSGKKAGFGELGRHGSIIHPRLGPLFRMGSVVTSLSLATDQPIDAGIAEFCDNCRACRRYCPANAIPDHRNPEAGLDHLGNPRYVVDTGRCFPYFAKHYYCSICLPVCVYNHKEWARDFDGFQTKLFPQVVMETPPEPVDLPVQQRHAYNRLDRE